MSSHVLSFCSSVCPPGRSGISLGRHSKKGKRYFHFPTRLGIIKLRRVSLSPIDEFINKYAIYLPTEESLIDPKGNWYESSTLGWIRPVSCNRSAFDFQTIDETFIFLWLRSSHFTFLSVVFLMVLWLQIADWSGKMVPIVENRPHCRRLPLQ